ncbi:MAG: carbon monoxide dehydrogenase subunit G [Pseudomonadota bacterium]
MEMSGERLIAAPRQAVWAALNDPEVLKSCIPGCTDFEATEDGGFAATVKQKVGPVSATFKGAVTLSDVVEGESYTISGEGKGGAAGFAKGGAKVSLADAEGGAATELTYTAEAKVGGKLAQLGSRLIDGFAKKMADQFFDRFSQAVAPSAPEAEPEAAPEPAPQPEPVAAAPAPSPAPAAAAPTAAPAPAAEPEKKKGWFSRLFG